MWGTETSKIENETKEATISKELNCLTGRRYKGTVKKAKQGKKKKRGRKEKKRKRRVWPPSPRWKCTCCSCEPLAQLAASSDALLLAVFYRQSHQWVACGRHCSGFKQIPFFITLSGLLILVPHNAVVNCFWSWIIIVSQCRQVDRIGAIHFFSSNCC